MNLARCIILLQSLLVISESIEFHFYFLVDFGSNYNCISSCGRGMGSAPYVVMDDIEKKKILADHTVHYNLINVTESTHSYLQYSNREQDVVHIVIGSANQDVCEIAGLVSSAYLMSHLSYGCSLSGMEDRKLFKTFLSFVGSTDQVCQMVCHKLAIKHGWVKITILWSKSARVYSKFNLRSGLEDLPSVSFSMYPIEDTEQIYRHIEDTEVIILFAQPDHVMEIVRTATNRGLNDGKRLFVTYLSLRSMMDADMNGLIVIDYKIPDTKAYHVFQQRVVNAFEQIEFEVNDHVIDPEKVYIEGAFLYDSTFLMARAIHKTLAENDGIYNSQSVMNNILADNNEEALSGVTRVNRMDDISVKLSVYVIQSSIHSLQAIPIFDYDAKHDQLITVNSLDNINWPGGSRNMPASHTVIRGTDSVNIGVIVAVLVSVVAASLIGFGGAFVHKKMKHEEDSSLQQTWAIPWSLIKQHTTDEQQDQSTDNSRAFSGLTDSIFHSESQLDQTTALYKDRNIVIKSIPRPISNEHWKLCYGEFASLRRLHHENVCEFIGACIDNPPYIYICTEWCSNGSVWDIINKKDLNLSWDFRLSLITDIAKGMAYLHKSSVGSHGNLTSKNCVVNARWMCKIAGFGSSRLRPYLDIPDSENAEELLWTAPELLRIPSDVRSVTGTKQGDVYSYGIIVQEVCYHRKPFGSLLDQLGALAIITKVKRHVMDTSASEFRPPDMPLPLGMQGDTSTFNPHWILLMELCWHEVPTTRPLFPQVLHIIKRIGDRKIDPIQNMIRILDAHAQKLQEIVMLRGQEVFEQQTREETLLYSILPREVVGQLKQGLKVLPESFEAVTIFVCDVVSFTPLAASMTPFQVINFLSELYNMFDEIIDSFDIHKVETIGDAYVVASGLPVRNGNKHASAMANFALAIIANVRTFKIPDFPEKHVNIRVGLHTGPVLAGVVGVKMRRYCLFGETVLVANMVSDAAEPMMVCVSETTVGILREYYSQDFIITTHNAVIPRNLKLYNLIRRSYGESLWNFV